MGINTLVFSFTANVGQVSIPQIYLQTSTQSNAGVPGQTTKTVLMQVRLSVLEKHRTTTYTKLLKMKVSINGKLDRQTDKLAGTGTN